MKSRLLAVALILGIGAIASPVFSTDAEPNDLPEASLAKLAKARAKSSTMGSSQRRSSDGSSESGENSGISDCGINIGNSVNAPRGAAPKEIIVVVKGDVINANNRCK
jgi:hypothetical protein